MEGFEHATRNMRLSKSRNVVAHVARRMSHVLTFLPPPKKTFFRKNNFPLAQATETW
jgi:hypothetical protein